MIKKILKKIFSCFEKPKNLWPIDKLAKGAMAGYQSVCGYTFDLNNPTIFTEKLIWYKLFYENDDLVNIVDKYLFKGYIKNKLGEGYTLPLYGHYETIDELKLGWNDLPQEFVLKSNLQSDGKFIKFVRDKNSVDTKSLFKELKNWLKVKNTLINSYCHGYYKAVPCIIAEKYEENVAGQLFDYKAYCFSGEPYCICASVNHFGDAHYPITYYDLNWNKLDVKSGIHKNDDIPKPPHFQEMLALSRKLSADFPFVRVDFFDTKEKLYLAELTFYPGGGLFKYDPPSFNKIMGDLFVLPEK